MSSEDRDRQMPNGGKLHGDNVSNPEEEKYEEVKPKNDVAEYGMYDHQS